ncbi:hypothetical protein SeLEV6574_g08180 [Synchytrium endobioticum]|uniref:Uncharacterized protein n=1 Tax=Synchytrium endobioticum TaxID=286115 RepID=A0A507CBP2_9FUNG|nr:hypothetical protein SeLEV6574_g08180 [Synchytrium endobioticum]
MAATTACSIKVTVVMCLLWMVFLSASAAGNSEEDELAQRFKKLGAYANGYRLVANRGMFMEFLDHVKRMAATFEPIYDNLGPKLERSDYSVVEGDLKDLKYLRILVTTEKLPWVSSAVPGQRKFPFLETTADHYKAYHEYLRLVKNCATLFRKHMNNVVSQLNKAHIKLNPKICRNAYLGDEPDMTTVRRIISNELYIWGENVPETWTEPDNYAVKWAFSKYRPICVKSSRLINAHDQKYGGYTFHLNESPMDTALQGTINHGNQNSVVTSGVTEPIALTQQRTPVTMEYDAEMSYGGRYTDESEFGSIPNFSLDYLHDNTLDHSRRVTEPIALTQQRTPVTMEYDAEMSYGGRYTDESEFGSIPNFSLDYLHDNTLDHSRRVTEPIALTQQRTPVTMEYDAEMSYGGRYTDESEFGSIPNFSLDYLHDNTLDHSRRVTEPIALTQQRTPVTMEYDAEMSYGGCYTDESEFGSIPNFSLDYLHDNTLDHSSRVTEPIASNQQWPLFTNDGNAETLYGYAYADTSEFGYNSFEGTTRFAHPPTSYEPASPFSPYAGTGVSYPFPTIDPANPSEYGYSNPPSGSKRLKRRSARFRS